MASVLAHVSVLLAALVVLQRTTPPRPPAEMTVALEFVEPRASQTPAIPSPQEADSTESALPPPTAPPAAESQSAATEPPSEQLPSLPPDEPPPTPEPAAAEPSPAAVAERQAVATKPKAGPPASRRAERPKPPARYSLRPPSQTQDAASEQATAVGVPMLPAHPVAGMESDRPPVYPEAARRRGQQGRVLLQVNVSASGAPVDVTVAQSSGFASLDDAALRAVEQWRFVPASRGGTAVPAVAEVPVRFRLTN